MSTKYSELTKALKSALAVLRAGGYIGDAETGTKWITTSNGKKVELDKDGKVVKGLGGSQKGVPIKEAAKNISEKPKGVKLGQKEQAAFARETGINTSGKAGGAGVDLSNAIIKGGGGGVKTITEGKNGSLNATGIKQNNKSAAVRAAEKAGYVVANSTEEKDRFGNITHNIEFKKK